MQNEEIKALLMAGINHSISESERYYDDDTKNKQMLLNNSILHHIDSLVDDPSLLNNTSKSALYRYIIDNDLNHMYDVKKWKSIIDDSSLRVSVDGDVENGLASNTWDIINCNNYGRNTKMFHGLLANCISKQTSWNDILNTLSPYIGYSSDSVRFIFDKLLEEDVDSFLSVIEINAFKKVWPYKLRGVAYSALCRSGLLTKKYARRLRSEASEYSSLCGVKSLIENVDLYTNSDELLVQFMDTRYPDVAHELAKNVPIHMLSYLVGSDFYHAKSVAERRMNQYLREKEDG